jgi:hypothetical protein
MDFGFVDDGRYIEVPSAFDGAFDSLTDNDTFTVALWINGVDQPVNQWTFYAGPGRQFGSHTPWGDGTIYFDVAGCCGADTRISQNEPDPLNYSDGWNHYAFIKDETYTAIYQNGELWHDSGVDEKSPLSFIEELYVGSGPLGDQRSYSGLIDDFGIWDNVLSDEEIMELFEGGMTGQTPGDYNNDGVIDAADADAQAVAMKEPSPNLTVFDENDDGAVDSKDRTIWVHDHAKTWYGDANLDNEFNSGDLVTVFAAGKYETEDMAGWAEGDWDGDMMFGSGDLVVAFADGGYEQGPPPAVAIPEPGSFGLFGLGLLLAARRWRRS